MITFHVRNKLRRGTYSKQNAASNVTDRGSPLLHIRPHHALDIAGDVTGHEVNCSHVGESEEWLLGFSKKDGCCGKVYVGEAMYSFTKGRSVAKTQRAKNDIIAKKPWTIQGPARC